MTAGPLYLFANHSTGFVANNVSSMFALQANYHLRHVRVTGNMTWLPLPTNVVSDDGAYMGVQAVAPAVAPAVPSVANAGIWVSMFWGRPPITATEVVDDIAQAWLRPYRWFFDFEFDCNVDLGAVGALYVGWQEIYVDANHTAPDVSYTCIATGYTT